MSVSKCLALVSILAVSFGACAADLPYGERVMARGDLRRSRATFENEKVGRVAFLGGSITEMDGYRPMVSKILERRFPQTKFHFVNAGIGSTCSTTGAFRLTTDVFNDGAVDLLFVEFAVNDDQDAAHTHAECVRGMEGIVRHARQLNPNVDVVIIYFVNEGMLQTLQSGKTPLTVSAHEEVAKAYDVPSVHLAAEVAREISAGELTWKDYGGVHPAPRGNRIAADMIDELFSRMWAGPVKADAPASPHPMPENMLDPMSYAAGRFIDPAQATVVNGWTLAVPDWKSLPGSKRSRFTSIPMLCATEPGAECTLAFTGTAVGAYVLAGPDAGALEASVDGGAFQNVNLYHRFSKGLHYPRTVMLATDLKPGDHALRLRVSDQTKSAGHAARIMQFVAN